ncbi:nuclear transport factor 2 family protein [Nonomuraea sp. NPDC049269]|uniref:nuclear transport factor 2 family protein n=1 Tax=Nonomuraea sp. NPDC049269 TaxID=3364349 RepID=UPI003718276D
MTATNGAALQVALDWFHARIGHDIDKTMSCVADDIVCDAPGAHVEGSEGFRAFEESFLPMITGATLLAAFGDEETALLMYDLATIPVPSNITTVRATITDGKIATLRIVYDQTPFAALQGGPQAQ